MATSLTPERSGLQPRAGIRGGNLLDDRGTESFAHAGFCGVQLRTVVRRV